MRGKERRVCLNGVVFARTGLGSCHKGEQQELREDGNLLLAHGATSVRRVFELVRCSAPVIQGLGDSVSSTWSRPGRPIEVTHPAS